MASSAPLDQFVVRNPSYFFDASPEHALINPDNLHILLDHVKCAAFELPFSDRRARSAGTTCRRSSAILAEQGLRASSGRAGDGQWNWTNESYPADAVSLRSVSSDNFVVVDTHAAATRVIGETDFTSGPSTLHEKAIYIVEGQLFQVERLDFEGRKAYRARGRLRLLHRRDHLHEGDDPGHVRVETGDRRRMPSPTLPTSTRPRASHGEVHVVSRVVGFKKIKFYTNENVGSGELDLPEQQMHTTSYWLTIPAGVDGGAAVRAPTIGATAWSGWRSRCGRSRSCC